MKANRSARAQSIANANAKPRANQNKRTMGIVAVGVVTFLLILWVFAMSQNATKTVQVAMYAKNIYKNQQITADMFIPYDMLQSEYDNFASTYKDGTTKRKVILYSEVNTLVGTYAAYPLRAETYALWTDFFTSRTDNSDSVLYSYPGKNLVVLDVDSGTIKSFSSFLKPGDRINVIASFDETAEVKVYQDDGSFKMEESETHRNEPMFQDIVLADMLNSDGQSILDLYEYYDTLDTYSQANLDASDDWAEQTTPDTILVALTPEEVDTLYYYQSKSGVTFYVTVPQRNE